MRLNVFICFMGRKVCFDSRSQAICYLDTLCLGRTTDHCERGLQAKLQFQTDWKEREGRGWGFDISSKVPTPGYVNRTPPQLSPTFKQHQQLEMASTPEPKEETFLRQTVAGWRNYISYSSGVWWEIIFSKTVYYQSLSGTEHESRPAFPQAFLSGGPPYLFTKVYVIFFWWFSFKCS